MNTRINHTVIPFLQHAHSVSARIRKQGLLELLNPPTPIQSAGFLLAGENCLLPAAQHPLQRYGCCVYLISLDGRKALPIVSCRDWFHAPLPAVSNSHPVWSDMHGGLAEAAQRLADSRFDLNGAICAARTWMGRRRTEVSTHEGSAILIGHDTHVLCAARPMTPPPPPAASIVVPAFLTRALSQRHTMKMAA